jgi:hypothetical protein
MIIWGIKDNDSWRSAVNPLLYTSGLAKKKAWYGVRSALRHRAIVKEQSGIEQTKEADSFSSFRSNAVYTLQGICMGTAADWSGLSAGIYVINGKLRKR